MVNIAVILAAGLCNRLSHYISGQPKGFLQIGNLSLIERSIHIILRNNISKIIIGTGYQEHFFDNLKCKYPQILTKKNEIYDQTGSFYTLYNLKNLIDDNFLLLESDLLYEERAVTCLQKNIAKDVILASGKTNSQDEVYIEADKNHLLVNMSKNKNDINSVSGELVGISKISLETFQKVCALYKNRPEELKKIEYELAFASLSQSDPIKIDVIEDLVWTDIDTEDHLNRAKSLIYPRILEIEKHY